MKLCLQSEKNHLRLRIEPEIKSRAITHAGGDVHLPVPRFGILPDWCVPSFIATELRLADDKSNRSKHEHVKHAAVRMPREKQCWSLKLFSCFFQSCQEEFEAIRTVQKDDIHIIAAIIQFVDIRVHQGVTLFMRHQMQAECKRMDSVDADVFSVYLNLFHICRIDHELCVDIFLQVFSHLRKRDIFVIVIAHDREIAVFTQTIEENIRDIEGVPL